MADPTVLERIEETADELRRIGVREKYVISLQSVTKDQNAMLARLAKRGIRKKFLRKLKRCGPDQVECPNRRCSAACHFGGRLLVSEHIIEAHALLSATGLPIWFVTVVHPFDRVPLDELRGRSLAGIKIRMRRSLAEIEQHHPVFAFGAIEASLEECDDRHWLLHTHCAVATAALEKTIRAAFRPGVPLRGIRRPVLVRKADNVGNLCSYVAKMDSAQHVPLAVGRNGGPDMAKNPLQGGTLDRARAEYDLWLDAANTDRLILRSMRRVHGRLQLSAGLR